MCELKQGSQVNKYFIICSTIMTCILSRLVSLIVYFSLLNWSILLLRVTITNFASVSNSHILEFLMVAFPDK
jgi:hypothetical protein